MGKVTIFCHHLATMVGGLHWRKRTSNEVFDLEGQKMDLYPEVLTILKRLKKEQYTLAIASRCKDIRGTQSLLEFLEIEPYFKHIVIQRHSKRFHFEKLKEESNVEFNDMLFYDAEARNVIATGRIGVPSILVRYGLDIEIFDEGLGRYAKMKMAKRKGPFPLSIMSREKKADT